MNILDRFEQSFERLMEGSISRLFRSPIQPAEIGRKLERAMASGQVVSVGSMLVPNDYRVAMHPSDMVVFADYVSALCRQMEGWLSDLAAERGYTVIDRIRVQIAGDKQVPRRAIKVAAAISAQPQLSRDAQDAIQRTEIFRVVRQSTGIQPVRLVVQSGNQRGQEVILRQPVTTVGRALDNDVVLESADVSRHHARFELDQKQLSVVDLGSTNGTRVNGHSIRNQTVGPGDEVTFGTLTLQILAPEENAR